MRVLRSRLPDANSTGLWRHRQFMRFWTGETISFLGNEVTALALPLTAVLVLRATPLQMGLLVALRNLPQLLIGLMAGVWVDRMRRRPLLIFTDLSSGLLLLSIPAAALLGLLTMSQIYLVSFAVGIVGVVATVAYQSYLPSLVPREQLVEGNSKLTASESITGTIGPGVAGLLVQLVTAPVAIFVDALSFFISAIFLGSIGASEPAPMEKRQRRGIIKEIGEGLGLVLHNPLLRSLVQCGATHNFCSSMLVAVYVLYVLQELHIGPALLGVIFMLGGPGSLLGALVSARLVGRLGLGPVIIGAQVLTGVARLLIPAAVGPLPVMLLLLVLSDFLLGLARSIFNVNQLSLRQGITPDRLQGRVNATMRFLLWGITPLGALLGGLLGENIGLRPTLFIAASGVLLSSLWVLFSPLRLLTEQPGLRVEEAAC